MSSKKLPADDLFEKSSMSFGEHLEELRRSLAKALIWVAIGTLLGLGFAKQIVRFVEEPLKGAIQDFHIEQAKLQYEEANGEKPSEEMVDWLKVQGMIPERVFIEPEMPGSFALGEPTAGVLPTAEEASDEKTEVAETADEEEVAETENSEVEPQEDPSEVTTDVPNAASIDPLANPWQNISLSDLESLQPLLIWRPIPKKLISLNPVEGFMIWLKAGLVAGVVIASPGIFFHIWQFLAAGLYPHERRYVYWYLPLSLVLFLGGVFLAFFVVFRLVLGFLMQYSTGLDVEFTPRLNDYMSFVLFLPLGFGIAFQLPIVMLGLHRFGVVNEATFLSQWRIAVLAIAFLSMMLSPPDIYSMLGLFIPLVALYFFGIMLCRYMPRGAGIGSPTLDPQG